MSIPSRHAWRWVVSAYFAQGVPFAIVMSAASTLLKDLHYPNARITPVIGTIALVWSLKPLYAGFLELLAPIRFWVLSMEVIMAGLLLLGAAALQFSDPFWPLSVVFGLLAFASATQDIAIDGVFVTSLGDRQQSRWAGVCGSAWNGGRLFAAAAMVGVASALQSHGNWAARASWAVALCLAAAVLLLLAAYHRRALPERATPDARMSVSRASLRTLTLEFIEQWRALFTRPGVWGMLAFVLLYRTSEGFLLLEVPLFLQSPTTEQGLGLCATEQLTLACPHPLQDRALLDGVLGTLVSSAFGLLGGKYLEWAGLTRRSLMFMACCLNLPHITLVILSQLAAAQVSVDFSSIAWLVLIEKAGYSFGFVANMVYIMQRIAPGPYPMTHYALATALMQLMLVPTQAASGPLAAYLSYPLYFGLACVAAVPSLWAAWKAPLGRAQPSVETTRSPA